MNRAFLLLILSASLASFGAACRTAGTSGEVPTTDDTPTDDSGSSSSPKKRDAGAPACDLGNSRSLSESCCEDLGVDACGAKLFCAAFDGRKQATCYPEGSREDMTECTDDAQCISGECNAGEAACKSLQGAACTEVIGCVSAADKTPYVCTAGTCKRDPSYCPANTLKSGKVACDTAIGTSCCTAATVCSEDPDCVTRSKCAFACPVGDTSCLYGCASSSYKLQNLYSCVSKLPDCPFGSYNL